MKPETKSDRHRRPRIILRGAIYFVTWRLHDHQTELTPDDRSAVVSALRHFDSDRYELIAFVVMNDHVHVLFTPGETETLEGIVHSWKSFTANRLQREQGRRGTIWQHGYFDRVVRNDEELAARVAYIINNPLKRWPDVENYPWVWAKTG